MGERAEVATSEHPVTGLKHGPEPSYWDHDTVLWAPDWRSRSGHTSGWLWATDSFTVCGVQDDGEDDDDSTMGQKAVEYLSADLTAPLYAAEPRDLSVLGGIAHLRDWGIWDLDRVTDAAFWVIGDEGAKVVLAVDPGPALRIVGPSGRMAVVMGVRETGSSWFPAIDLPVTDAAEPVDIHTWFSLSYSSYLVVNRSILQSMPEEWQHQFTALLDEMNDRYSHVPWPTYEVRVRGEDGRYRADPIPHYNRGRTYIEPRVDRG